MSKLEEKRAMDQSMWRGERRLEMKRQVLVVARFGETSRSWLYRHWRPWRRLVDYCVEWRPSR